MFFVHGGIKGLQGTGKCCFGWKVVAMLTYRCKYCCEHSGLKGRGREWGLEKNSYHLMQKTLIWEVELVVSPAQHTSSEIFTDLWNWWMWNTHRVFLRVEWGNMDTDITWEILNNCWFSFSPLFPYVQSSPVSPISVNASRGMSSCLTPNLKDTLTPSSRSASPPRTQTSGNLLGWL